jgi:hypothetical protein
MNAIPYEDRTEDWDRYGDEGYDEALPGRPRRQFFNRWSALLLALLLGGIGFFVGVRVEKSQLSSSSAGSRLAAAASSAASTGAAGRTGAGRFAGGGGFGAGAGAAGGASFGTVASVNGNTIYVTDTSGNTVKVKLSGATKITKSESVGKGKIYPGDTVVISGVKGSNGTLNAATLSDSGTRAGASGSGSGNSGSGASSASSAVNSLFGSGGG